MSIRDRMKGEDLANNREDDRDTQVGMGFQDTENLDAEGLLKRAVDIVNTAKSMPLSASVLVSRDDLVGVLAAALDRMPDELRQARWLLREKEEFLEEQTKEAESLMEEVRAQAAHMVSRTEVVRQANQVAQRILSEANEEARRLRHEVEDYCDQKLAGMEIVLDRIVRTVQAGRGKLHATITGGGEGAGTRDGEPGGPTSNDSGEIGEGFFDQDNK